MRTDSTSVIEQFEGDTLVTRELLHAIARRIVNAFHPEKIILFGSYAYGEPTLDSDIDLLVIMRSRKRPVQRSRAISELFLHRRFGMDLLVRTPKELENRLGLGDCFFREITQKGKVLYARRSDNSSRLGGQSGNGLQKRARPRAAVQRPAARQGHVRLAAPTLRFFKPPSNVPGPKSCYIRLSVDIR